MAKRTTGLTSHKDIYREKLNKVTHLISQSKKEHYKAKIAEADGDQKVLFRCVNELLRQNLESLQRTGDCPFGEE